MGYLDKIMPLVTVTRATRAASEVCRMTDPKVSELVYPLMQNLDFWALDADIAYGGIDQRHVYMLGRELLLKLGFKKPVLVFTPLGLSLNGKEKMSASKYEGRLEFHATPEEIYSKILSAYCPTGETEVNPILEYVKYLIFPRFNKVLIERRGKYGGDIGFSNYNEFEKEYLAGNIHPLDLKNATAAYLIQIFEPIRKYHEKHEDMFEVFKK
ncbi:MAG: tyrosine--tRNA ligase [Candidatus Aenigmatarchaeota archaeon]